MLSKIKNTIIALAATITSVMAQSPNMINYQGVAHNVNGTAIANQAIKVRLKIHTASAGGAVQYSEVRNVTTDASGLFNIQIGSTGAVSTTGSWAGITWENGAKYLQVEMDPTGGTTYTNMGTQQLVSVPYAQHAKSAASLSSGAMVAPSQIATAGASNNQVLQFNGTNWGPASVAAGSSFNLPYVETDSVPSVLFDIRNTSDNGGGLAIRASAVNGIGIMGSSDKTHGIYAATKDSLSAGVFGYSFHGYGKGLWGRTTLGTGVYGQSMQSGTGVLGTSSSGIGVKGTTSTTNSGGAAIYGLNSGTAGSGILGIANFASGYGVQGSSTTGTGVFGYSNSNIGVSGSTINGIGVSGYSITGYGLQSYGKVKIYGGNTSPGNGKVLTSDATGNATWKDNKIGFKVKNALTGGANNFAINTWSRVFFTSEEYDDGNSIIAGNSNATSSQFTAPVAGLYHFDATIEWGITGRETYMGIFKVSNGVETPIILHADGESMVDNCGIVGWNPSSHTSTDVKLAVGDKVYVKAYVDNGCVSGMTNTHGGLETYLYMGDNATSFNGHLVYAE